MTFWAMLKVEQHDFEEQFGGLFLIRTRALLTQIAEEPGDGGMDHWITIIFRRGKILVRPVRAPIFGLGVPSRLSHNTSGFLYDNFCKWSSQCSLRIDFAESLRIGLAEKLNLIHMPDIYSMPSPDLVRPHLPQRSRPRDLHRDLQHLQHLRLMT